MSASTYFPLYLDAPSARVTGPWGPAAHVHLELTSSAHLRSPTVSVSCTNEQLADIARAILAHLEKQEQGDFDAQPITYSLITAEEM
jgi:hypothetical protein